MTELTLKIDALGNLDRQIKALTKQADDIKNELKLHGPSDLNGTNFNATVYEIKGRTTIDWVAIAALYNIPADVIEAHTTTGASTLGIKVKTA